MRREEGRGRRGRGFFKGASEGVRGFSQEVPSGFKVVYISAL